MTWIGVRPGRKIAMEDRAEVLAISGKGLKGDRYSGGGKRQLTLIQEEHLFAIGSILGRDPIDPTLTRRNLVVKG